MDTIILLTIITTALLSYKGFNDSSFFQKYKFKVYAVDKRKEYIRFLSSGFLHADWMHLIFNMITLYFFAPIVAYFFGDLGFLFIYFGSMFLGNLLSFYLYKNSPFYSAIGASGAVSGILFSAIALNPMMTIGVFFIPMTGYIFGFLYFAYSVYMMLNPKQWDNMGHSAHLGGAIFGIFYTLITKTNLVIDHIYYIAIMSLPLIYLGYIILSKRK